MVEKNVWLYNSFSLLRVCFVTSVFYPENERLASHNNEIVILTPVTLIISIVLQIQQKYWIQTLVITRDF